MSTPSRIRRTLGITGGSLAAVGLFAGPAAAHLQGRAAADHTPRTSPVAHSDHEVDRALTQAEFQAALDRKLDRLSTRLAADEAQWSAVADSTVLIGRQRGAARSDLAHTQNALRRLASVPTAGPYSASLAQQATIALVRDRLTALTTKLTTLLANEPAAAAPQPAPPVTGVTPPASTTEDERDDADEDAEHEDAEHEDGDRDRDWDGDHDGDRDEHEDGDHDEHDEDEHEDGDRD